MSRSVAVTRTQLMQLAVRGDWGALEQILKGVETAEPEISQVDEVRDLVFYSLFSHKIKI